DAESVGEAAPDQIRAPGTPGPELRADVIDVSNAFGTQLASEAEMEAGEVGENREGRLATCRFVNQVTHGADQGGQSLKDFGDAHYRDFGVVGDDLDAGRAHLRATHAEERYVHALLESDGETGGVHITGSFA